MTDRDYDEIVAGGAEIYSFLYHCPLPIAMKAVFSLVEYPPDTYNSSLWPSASQCWINIEG
jgi:hypothetical protein